VIFIYRLHLIICGVARKQATDDPTMLGQESRANLRRNDNIRPKFHALSLASQPINVQMDVCRASGVGDRLSGSIGQVAPLGSSLSLPPAASGRRRSV
jgi:hypothetical protein